jgi:hypothetical protein
MLQAPELVRESLNELLDTLDQPAEASAGGDGQHDRRLRLRRSFRTECTVKCFPCGGPAKSLAGVTRNISFRGLAVLLPAAVVPGHPVELRIDLPDQQPTYVAGVAVFCRKVAQGYHEAGLQLHAAGSDPLFPSDPSGAAGAPDWLAEALAQVTP